MAHTAPAVLSYTLCKVDYLLIYYVSNKAEVILYDGAIPELANLDSSCLPMDRGKHRDSSTKTTVNRYIKLTD